MGIYTGVGSRKTPEFIMEVMYVFARIQARLGHTGRSGHADGADYAFEKGMLAEDAGLKGLMEIYLPWKGFNGATSGPGYYLPSQLGHWEEAEAIVAEIHPAWGLFMSNPQKYRGAIALHTRNVFQVLGKTLKSPSDYLVCYAEVSGRGGVKGGTATAVELARRNNVQVFNLIEEKDLRHILSIIKDHVQKEDFAGCVNFTFDQLQKAMAA